MDMTGQDVTMHRRESAPSTDEDLNGIVYTVCDPRLKCRAVRFDMAFLIAETAQAGAWRQQDQTGCRFAAAMS